jgi:pilus assembly protein CpaB
MKNIKAIAFLILALLAALAAAAYATIWVSRQANIAASKVVVAAMDIELGTKVNPQMLTAVDWPSGSVPPGAFRDVKELQDRVVRASLQRGEPVLERKLAPAGTQGGLSAVIAEGKRAMTVRVNEVVGVAGFALPGNYVDVLVNAQRENAKGQPSKPVSITVLSHVLVLAVAQEAGRDETKPKVVSAVTLELTPQDAEKLDLARSVGALSLVLRNQLDRSPVQTTGITKAELLGDQEPVLEPVVARSVAPVHAKAAPRVEPAACVEVIQHATRALDCF